MKIIIFTFDALIKIKMLLQNNIIKILIMLKCFKINWLLIVLISDQKYRICSHKTCFCNIK